MRHIAIIIACLAATICAYAQNDWLHIYLTDSIGKTRVRSLAPSGSDTLSYIRLDSLTDGYDALSLNALDTIPLASLSRLTFGRQIPAMHIDIEDSLEVTSKEEYLNARIWVRGNGYCEDFDTLDVQIKGRGNSTWAFPKKPYRLKFNKKQKLGGLPNKAKSFVLLANLIDPTLLKNAVAFKIAEMIGMPYSNHAVPVDLTVNGTYRGSYLLTEKIGINSGSVDINQTEGMLFELDTNYDEEYKFTTEDFNLPVMFKEDLAEIAAEDTTGILTPDSLMVQWQADFEQLTYAVAHPDEADWTELLDLESVAKYVFVFNLTFNNELNHPKSVYIYKERAGEKYHLGPVWDFDWSFSFTPSGDDMEFTIYSLFGSKTNFIATLSRDKRFIEVFRALVDDFYENHFDDLLAFIDDYAALIEPSAYLNGEIWPLGSFKNDYYTAIGSTEDFAAHIATLKEFITRRMDYIHRSRRMGL